MYGYLPHEEVGAEYVIMKSSRGFMPPIRLYHAKVAKDEHHFGHLEWADLSEYARCFRLLRSFYTSHNTYFQVKSSPTDTHLQFRLSDALAKFAWKSTYQQYPVTVSAASSSLGNRKDSFIIDSRPEL